MKPHLSPSQLDTIFTCGEAWRRRYIEGEIIPLGIAMIQGTGVHGGAEENFRQKIESHRDLSRTDIVDAAVAAYDNELLGGFVRSAEDPDVDEARDQVAGLAAVFSESVAPEYQPRFVEQEVRIVLPGKYDMLGYLDLADDHGRVVDIKTVGRSKTQADCDSSDQLTFYAAAHRTLDGNLASEVRLECLVKTKTPKRTMLSSTRDARSFEILASKINVVSAAIEKGVFLPASPGSWKCNPKYCGYFHTCPYVRQSPATVVDLAVPSAPIVRERARVEAVTDPIQRLLAMGATCVQCHKSLTRRTAVLVDPRASVLACRQCANRAADAGTDVRSIPTPANMGDV